MKSLRGWKMSRRADKKADKTVQRAAAAKPTGAVLHPTVKDKAAAGSKPNLAIVKTKPATQQIAPTSAHILLCRKCFAISCTASLPEKQRTYDWSELTSYDALVREFYAIDPATAADETQLNQKALLGRVLSVQKRTDDQPQILIYHTHSQETFADSIPGNAQTGIMGVGEVLAEILRKQYGYNVMHHMGQYDVEKRDYAYSNSLPALEAILKENPSIEVVIDLHRDEVAEGTRLVTEIGGKKMARFMFFNGLSRTRRLGDIDSLPNENIADNLAFSFQMQVLCNEYYPGLTRRIYLKGYRYNMHLKQRYLLIEMGAQTNTYEECMNSCVPLAQMLDLELSGKTDFTLDLEKG